MQDPCLCPSRSEITQIWGFRSTYLLGVSVDMFFGHTILGLAPIDMYNRTSRKSGKFRRALHKFKAVPIHISYRMKVSWCQETADAEGGAKNAIGSYMAPTMVHLFADRLLK